MGSLVTLDIGDFPYAHTMGSCPQIMSEIHLEKRHETTPLKYWDYINDFSSGKKGV
jgi:hypothetical protein